MSPIDYSKYPDNWETEIRPRILLRATREGESVPRCEFCGAINHEPHPETGSKVVLTIAHLDQDIKNSADENLRALCQKDHLAWDREFKAKTKKIIAEMLEDRLGIAGGLFQVREGVEA